jgi:hypothetical protein
MFRRRKIVSAFAAVAAIVALVGVTVFSSTAEAQKPGSSVVELCAPISASSNVTAVAPVPLGTQLRVGARLVGVLKVTTAGGAGNLDVYFQHSCDDGQTWADFSHVQQSAGSATTYYIPVSTIAAGSTSVAAIQDGAMTANTTTQGPLGDRLRIKYTVSSLTGGPWNFQAFVLPD